jgi:hypothetical protein
MVNRQQCLRDETKLWRAVAGLVAKLDEMVRWSLISEG